MMSRFGRLRALFQFRAAARVYPLLIEAESLDRIAKSEGFPSADVMPHWRLANFVRNALTDRFRLQSRVKAGFRIVLVARDGTQVPYELANRARAAAKKADLGQMFGMDLKS